MTDPTTAETPTVRDKLVRILAAEDPRNPWDGDEPEIGAHYSIMLGEVLREMRDGSLTHICEVGRHAADAYTGEGMTPSGLAHAWRAMLTDILNETKD